MQTYTINTKKYKNINNLISISQNKKLMNE